MPPHLASARSIGAKRRSHRQGRADDGARAPGAYCPRPTRRTRPSLAARCNLVAATEGRTFSSRASVRASTGPPPGGMAAIVSMTWPGTSIAESSLCRAMNSRPCAGAGIAGSTRRIRRQRALAARTRRSRSASSPASTSSACRTSLVFISGRGMHNSSRMPRRSVLFVRTRRLAASAWLGTRAAPSSQAAAWQN